MLLIYVVVFKYNKSLLVYNPNYSFRFPPGWYYKFWCFFLYLNETWKPTRWGGHDKVT